MSYNYKPRNPDGQFDLVDIRLPKSMSQALRGYSAEMGLPMARLVQYAIEAQLESAAPFSFTWEYPDESEHPYVEFAYAAECTMILNYLEHFKSGVAGLDQLILLRRDIGIPEKTRFMAALRELWINKQIELVKPPRQGHFKYPDGFMFISKVGMKPNTHKMRQQPPKFKGAKSAKTDDHSE